MHPLFPQAQLVIDDIVDAARVVLRTMGQGLLESVYEACLTRELMLRGHKTETEKNVVYSYRGQTFSTSLRADLLVDDCVVVELKSVERQITLEHQMQVLSYMKLLNYPLGIVINFGASPNKRFKRVILKGADTP